MIIGTIVGLVGSILPEVVKVIKDRNDSKHELEFLKVQAELQREKQIHSTTELEIKSDLAELRALLKHDSSGAQSTLISSLRGSVRPIITYAFFGLFAFVQIYGATSLEGQAFIDFIWDNNTQELFGAVIGFWFGNRSVEKWRK